MCYPFYPAQAALASIELRNANSKPGTAAGIPNQQHRTGAVAAGQRRQDVVDFEVAACGKRHVRGIRAMLGKRTDRFANQSRKDVLSGCSPGSVAAG